MRKPDLDVWIALTSPVFYGVLLGAGIYWCWKRLEKLYHKTRIFYYLDHKRAVKLLKTLNEAQVKNCKLWIKHQRKFNPGRPYVDEYEQAVLNREKELEREKEK